MDSLHILFESHNLSKRKDISLEFEGCQHLDHSKFQGKDFLEELKQECECSCQSSCRKCLLYRGYSIEDQLSIRSIGGSMVSFV
jgi:hypothetical protein